MPKKPQINNLPHLKRRRRDLRNNLTPTEAYLWKYLQKSQLDGRKFRRQHSVNNYILDFYRPMEKLAVELDGAHHFTEEGYQYDEKRSAILEKLGIRVLRFENREVLNHVEGVLEEIRVCFGAVKKVYNHSI